AMAVNHRSERAEQGQGQGQGAGEAPLTPIQRWFFEQQSPNVNHWNMALSFETSAPLIPSIVESALRSLLAHHDALRLRFTKTSAKTSGGWRQYVVADDQASFAAIDLSGLPADEQEAALRQASAAAQTALNISHGPLIRLLLFDMGEGQANRLLMVVHHLAIDAVSWRILLGNFETAQPPPRRGGGRPPPLEDAPF